MLPLRELEPTIKLPALSWFRSEGDKTKPPLAEPSVMLELLVKGTMSMVPCAPALIVPVPTETLSAVIVISAFDELIELPLTLRLSLAPLRIRLTPEAALIP